jgi:hypothetical protein
MADRVYTKDEADAILTRAIELQGRGGAASHKDLLATAREIGVAPEVLEQAAAEVLAGQREDQALRVYRAGRWRGFFAHLVPFVCVGVLLGFINVVTGGFPWAVIPMLAWGVGLASHLFAVAVPNEIELRLREAQRHAGGAARVRVEQEPSAGGANEVPAHEEDEPEIETDERTARRG